MTTLGAMDLRDRMGRPVREVLAQPKRLALLVYLASEAKHGPIARERLAALFWPSADAGRARNALSQALHHLRQALGSGVIENLGTHAVELNAGALWCDAAVFADAVERGDVDLALDLYRGDFCPALAVAGAPAVDAWLEEQRVRCRAAAMGMARALAERLRDGGDVAGAARAARRALALGPDDEADIRALHALVEPPATAGVPGGRAIGKPVTRPAWLPRPLTAALLVAVVGVVGVAAARFLGGDGPALDPDLVAVAPFRVAASDSSLGFLGDGMVDLLARRLNGAGRLRATDPQSIFAAWRASAGIGAAAGGPGAALARRLGAGWLVTGAVLGSPRRMVFAVSLKAVTTGASHEAEATGPLDSLAALVDDVALQLLPVISGEPQPRTAALSRTPMPALRAYLDGRSAFRGGRFDDAMLRLREAVALDSAFASAALELAYVAGFTAEGSARYLPQAVALRDLLPPSDRAVLTALAGPRYPAQTPIAEGLAAWERAVQAAPTSPAAWYDLGDYLFHSGSALGRDTAFTRSEAAFRRAAELDSGDVRALVHLTQIALQRGELAEARRLSALVFVRDSSTEQSQFLRWRVAVATGDSATVSRLEAALDTLPLGTVRRLVDWSQADGVQPGLPLRALEVLERRAASEKDAELALRLRLVVTMNAGRYDLWMSAVRRYVPSMPAADVAIQPYASLEGTARTVPRTAVVFEPRLRMLFELRECERQLPGACDRLRSAIAALPAGWQTREPMTEILAAAVLRLQSADSLVRRIDTMRERALSFAELALCSYVQGRAYAALGRPARALDALRRRPYATMEANNYLALGLRLEGRLAAEVGDTARAIGAYRHYLVLRADPDPDLRPTADSVRAELARLERRP